MINKSKEEQHSLFIAILEGYQTIYEYFGVKKFATYDYELQLSDQNWAIQHGTLHYEIPEKLDEGTYQSTIHGVHRKDHFTLIFTPSDTGSAGYAHIFDNDKEVKDLESRGPDE